jgi:mRNA-degrading endonuclease toxin of MazEF toxin-antitoxin module
VEQLGGVEAQRLGRRAELLLAEEMSAVDEALVTVSGLE